MQRYKLNPGWSLRYEAGELILNGGADQAFSLELPLGEKSFFSDLKHGQPFDKRAEEHKPPVHKPAGKKPKASLAVLKQVLKKSGIRMYYRSLTTIDACQAGTYVVRVISPDLAPIFSHQQWPFLGGSVRDIGRRYAVRFDPEKFPNPMPHPLG